MNYGRRSIKFGFTLIEILVVVSVMAILSSVGFASYINFSRSQMVTQAAGKIIEDLRLTQSLAANNQKPEGDCSTLDGYSFFINKSQKTYKIEVNCSPAYGGDSIRTGSVPSNLAITGFNKIEFKVLTRGVVATPPGSLILTVSGFGGRWSKTIRIDPGGAIKLENE
ncbi:MAG TPA: prepilin-type N-terminal cleavage/methylation domain-containing protein [Clostridia bacterium]|nr:prepilin-type N-terminal cleavage/methylation domain-containing protein [Clostridia bacterium]